jgi:hypothetical protein
VWNAYPERRGDILALLSATLTGDDAKDFGAFHTAIKKRSRALHICGQLANGSKHMTLKKPDPDVRVEMRWESEAARAGEMRAGDPLAVHHYRLMVSDKGVERTALDLFAAALKDWEWFLGEWGFVEGKLVPAHP